MGDTIRQDQHVGAERASRSAQAAEAYLRRLHDDDRLFVRELRAAWNLDGRRPQVKIPSPLRRVRRAERLARELLKEVGAGGALGRQLVRFLDAAGRRDPDVAKFRRRLATAPTDERFALVLANHAFSVSHDLLQGSRRVSGRLAAVIAAAEGVSKPKARRKPSQEPDPDRDRIRTWEAAMARASKMVAKWRRVD